MAGREFDREALTWLLTWLVGLIGSVIVGLGLGAEALGWQLGTIDKLIVGLGAVGMAGSGVYLLRWRKRIVRPHSEWEAIAQVRALSAAWGHSLEGRGDDEVRNAVMTMYDHLGPGGWL